MSDQILNAILSRLDRLEIGASSHNAVGWADLDAVEQKVKKIQSAVQLLADKHDAFVTKYATDQRSVITVADLKKANLKLAENIIDVVAENSNQDRAELKKYADANAVALRADVELAKAASTASTEHGKAVLIEWANTLGAN